VGRYHSVQKGGSACPQDDGIGSMAQISGGKAAWHSQRVEDNAFHLIYCQV